PSSYGDWSSDVSSSDLHVLRHHRAQAREHELPGRGRGRLDVVTSFPPQSSGEVSASYADGGVLGANGCLLPLRRGLPAHLPIRIGPKGGGEGKRIEIEE